MSDQHDWVVRLITSIDPANTDLILLQVYGYTVADVVIAFFCVRIAVLLRQKCTMGLSICYWLLGLTVVISPAFLAAKEDPYKLMLISMATAGIHYAIIIYALFSIRKPLIRLIGYFTNPS
jgi:cellulose synthase/poly-beta-1,6-N-acetylglucosamine synthase-like glycosyltransferase